jgi:hypothetical protein
MSSPDREKERELLRKIDSSTEKRDKKRRARGENTSAAI